MTVDPRKVLEIHGITGLLPARKEGADAQEVRVRDTANGFIIIELAKTFDGAWLTGEDARRLASILLVAADRVDPPAPPERVTQPVPTEGGGGAVRDAAPATSASAGERASDRVAGTNNACAMYVTASSPGYVHWSCRECGEGPKTPKGSPDPECWWNETPRPVAPLGGDTAETTAGALPIPEPRAPAGPKKPEWLTDERLAALTRYMAEGKYAAEYCSLLAEMPGPPLPSNRAVLNRARSLGIRWFPAPEEPQGGLQEAQEPAAPEASPDPETALDPAPAPRAGANSGHTDGSDRASPPPASVLASPGSTIGKAVAELAKAVLRPKRAAEWYLVRWAKERGLNVRLPLSPADMVMINAKAKSLGLPPFELAGRD